MRRSVLCAVVLPVFALLPSMVHPSRFAAARLPASAVIASPLNGIVVVIDPGHGGIDGGVDPAGSGLVEKEVVLDIAARLKRQLEETGARVLMTREDDSFASRWARIQFANAALFRPDNGAGRGRFVSLHVNSSKGTPDLRRVEVIVDPEAEGPFDFAGDLAARLRAATGGTVGYRDPGYPDGVHPSDIAVVRWTFPRGRNALSESAFLSNPQQAAQLRDGGFREAIARAHSEALMQEFVR